MRIPLTYQAAMQRLADLSGPDYPPHVQFKAVAKIATELSPNNPRHAEVMRALHTDDSPYEFAPPTLLEPGEHPYAALLSDGQDAEDDENESEESDDDPL